ncbi:thiamine phosphate synthase [Tenacibaculum sp. UWU-22]|uniref:thiamine phosphate synthase n=1 Tax=Tenacibaculum sp. UWU-22 TaxID=3234187 RepID=UPI0034DB4595
MFVLIAPEKDIPNEIQILQQLFEEGLEYYHLRKPNKNYKEHATYLNQIAKEHHNKIVTHYFHELINEFNLKGIHFQEQKRKDILENTSAYFRGLSLAKKTISSSFHEPKDIENCPIKFDYHLLSPVFSSISKKAYKGRGFDVNHINKTIIGLGGISTNTIKKTMALGFQGIGVLGSVWNTENPVQSFKNINRYYKGVFNTNHLV